MKIFFDTSRIVARSKQRSRLLIQHEICIYIVYLSAKPFDKNNSRRKRPRGVLWALSRWFLRAKCNRPNRAPSLFPLPRKSSRLSGVFALFSTINHGWLISKLGEENSRKLLSRIVFFSFFLFFSINATGTFTLATRIALESYFSRVDTVPRINYRRIFFDFRCSPLYRKITRENFISWDTGSVRIIFLRIVHSKIYLWERLKYE